ncbi:MAG: tRNA 2-thiouridine(34) synthase MnmA [Candidatus Omnitrophica bacterium]|nr:tRNA 2-thiouridine(34) synthase MnmA [Candidatus Omnitrophota bacterium]
MQKRVLVAMSGGVDSSVAAYLLKKEGYDVAGATMEIWPKESCGKQPPRACCSLKSIEDARSVCRILDIPFYVLNLTREFEKEVVSYFIKQYYQGVTPNPCIVCNEKIKFGVFLKKAKMLGFNYIATGHYARLIFDKESKRFQLREAVDKMKDQSYVLFPLSQEQLERTLFPVGDYNKRAIRDIARKVRLKIHNKPDSQEICFVLGDYKDFLKDRLKDKIRPGPIIYKDNTLLGKHNGICFYTVGQRKGLGLGYHRSLYVVRIDKESNAIIVGEKEDLKKKTLLAKGVNWVSIKKPENTIQVLAKIRYNHRKAGAVVSRQENGEYKVDFLKEQFAITPGQAMVFYKRDLVLGGGWIK